MERIGLVTNDPHLKAELQKWFGEIPGEFEFVDLGPPATGDPPPAPLRLIIFDSATGLELSKLRDDLNLASTPWLAIGLEEHAHNPHVPAIHGANDLILVPLDRLVFLQKVEYLLAGSESVTPSFLYLAKADFPIELAKAVHITHLSETGCTILAPRPLAPGVEGTLVSRIFGDGNFERVEIRAVDSNPVFELAVAGQSEHPEPKFEVRLRFFGLKHSQLTELRKWLAKHQPHGLPEIPRSNAAPKNVAHVAMISPQSSLANMVRSSLEDLAKFEIEEFAGFNRFHGELIARGTAPVIKEEPIGPLSTQLWSKEFVGPKTPADSRPAMPHPSIVLMVRLATESVPAHAESVTPTLKPHETLFEAAADKWTKDIETLTKSLSEQDRHAFDEAVQWTIANSTLTKHPETSMTADISVIDSASGVCKAKTHMLLKLSLAEAATPSRTALIKVHIDDISAQKVERKARVGQVPYEAILVDASLLDTDLKLKVSNVAEWLELFNIRNAFGNRPPILVFNATEGKIDAQDFRGTSVRQLAYDFNDRRHHAELFISLSRPELWTTPKLSVADLKTDLKAYLGRPAKASGISEAGLVVVDRSPLRKGTELLVLSPVWSQAPEGLWARLRMAAPKEGKEGEPSFENEFVFFGVSDLVQKEIRKFTREDYIKKKAQGQG